MNLLGNDDGFWFISLSEAKIYWYDLFVEPLDHESINTRDAIAEDLKRKEEIERSSEHTRFIYFFASRPRVRIDTSIPLNFDQHSGNLIFYVLHGNERTPIKIESRIELDDEIRKSAYVTCTDRSLRMYANSETSRTVSIHEFLSDTKQSLGNSTEILYVGSTVDQARRFLERKHRGVSDSIYQQGSESHDFFFYSNLFDVYESLYFKDSHTRIISKKVPLDLKDCREECSVIENGLICYFGCRSQELNKSNERAELRNKMDVLNSSRGVTKVAYHLEIDPIHSYFSFFSRGSELKQNHTFLYKMHGNELQTITCSGEAELAGILSPSNDA